MPALADLQADFRNAVLGGDDARAVDLIVDSAIPAGKRIQIHRNNTFITLTESLAAVYPVILRLVGKEFFEAVCRQFILAHPPRNRSLIFYGLDMASFLESFPPVDDLPYLPDVARLEWAWHSAYHAADAIPLAPERLAALDPNTLPALGLELHSTCRFVSSQFPIFRIWRANQPDGDADETINLADGGDMLMVIRPLFNVQIRNLNPPETAFLLALDGGADLGHAAEAALRTDPAFNIRDTLRDLISSQTFAQIIFPREDPRS